MLELVVSSQLNRAVGYCTSSQLLVIIVPNCWGTYHFLFPTEVPICCLQITTMFTRYFHIPILPISFYYPHVVNYIPMVGNNLIFPIHYHGQLYSPGWQLAGSYYSIDKKTCRKNIDDLSPMVNINYSPFIPMRWRRCRRWSMPLAFAACWTALAEMPPGRETW